MAFIPPISSERVAVTSNHASPSRPVAHKMEPVPGEVPMFSSTVVAEALFSKGTSTPSSPFTKPNSSTTPMEDLTLPKAAAAAGRVLSFNKSNNSRVVVSPPNSLIPMIRQFSSPLDVDDSRNGSSMATPSDDSLPSPSLAVGLISASDSVISPGVAMTPSIASTHRAVGVPAVAGGSAPEVLSVRELAYREAQAERFRNSMAVAIARYGSLLNTPVDEDPLFVGISKRAPGVRY